MKCVIFGKGLIGLKHADVLQQQFNADIRFFRHSTNEINDGEDICGWDEFENFAPNFAVIANPTNLHIKTCIECARRNVHLFIEKPFDCSDDELDCLKKEVTDRGLSTYVAYCLRFHPGLIELKKFVDEEPPLHAKVVVRNNLSNWNRKIDAKQTYSARKDMGGGVVFDLSHELDYLKFLFGDYEIVHWKADKVGDVTLDAPDVFNAIFTAGDTRGTIHLDYFSHKPERYIQLDYSSYSLYLPLKE